MINVRVYAVDWCGYQEDYTAKEKTVEETEANIQNYIDEYAESMGLVQFEAGVYTEMDNIDELIDEDDVTTFGYEITDE